MGQLGHPVPLNAQVSNDQEANPVQADDAQGLGDGHASSHGVRNG
jgi:hypothetical protein